MQRAFIVMATPLLTRLRAEWAPSIPRELLAGAVATFALIPEVIAFSFVAGVDPAVGLYASFVISIVIAFAGARPAMVSAAAGSVALVAAPLVASHGLSYLLAAGLLAGLVQIIFGWLRMGLLVARYIKNRRLDLCAESLRQSRAEQKLSALGYSWGFSDSSYFSTAFKSRFGISPGEYRKQYA